MTFLISLLALIFAVEQTKISLVDAPAQTGQLKAITSSEVTLTKDGTVATLQLADVLMIECISVTPVPSTEPQLLSLSDGSQLHGSGSTSTAREFQFQSPDFGKLAIRSDRVRSIRLQAENPAFTAQWNTLTQRNSDTDLLVVVKRDGSGLDFLTGIVTSISVEKTDFLIDGETVPVPSARVYGVVFSRTADENADDPERTKTEIQLTSARGDVVVAKGVTLEADSLHIESAWKQQLRIPMNQLRTIDFSRGRLQFLSDLKPVKEQFYGVDPEGSLLAGLIDAEQQLQLFGPRRDTTMERRSKLRLRGREFLKGLCVHSKTEISWEVDGRYSALECQIGIDDEVAFNGDHSVAVRITGDNSVLFEKLIASSDAPLPLRLPLDGISTLTILVDFGDNDSICDWLDFADAKLLIAKDKQ